MATKLYLLFGPQGSGKSTQGEILAKKYGWKWLSAGEVLREAAKTNKDIEEAVSSGKIAPVEITNKLIAKAIDTCETAVILDGYPRVIEQAKPFLEKFSEQVCSVFYLDLNKDTAIERLLSRGRADDNKEEIATRLDIFYNETLPLLKYFEEYKIKVVKINGDDTIENIANEIDAEISKN